MGGAAQAADVYWDGDSTGAGNVASGTGLGGSGSWNTSLSGTPLLNWWSGSGSADQAWVNASGDRAVFTGTAGTVTLTDVITTGGLLFNTTTYTIDAGANTLTFSPSSTITLNNVAAATITGAVAGTGAVTITRTSSTAGTLTLNGTSTGGWSGSTTISNGATLALAGSNQALLNTSSIALGGSITLTNTNGTEAALDRVSNAASITSTGGIFTVTNTSGGTSAYAETVGAVGLSSGALNIISTNANAGGSQVLTLGGLTQSGSATVAFGAGGGLNTGTNQIKVTGAAATTAGQIIGPWATTGTAANAQTDYAVYNGTENVVAANIAASAETTWTASANAYTLSGGTTLTGTRTINALRATGGAQTLALGANNLETNGILNGGSGTLTISGTGVVRQNGTAAGNLYISAGNSGITLALAIANNTGALTLVKTGTGTLTINTSATYSGGTILQEGTITMGAGIALGTGNLTIGSLGGGPTATFTGNTHNIGNSATVTVYSNGAFSMGNGEVIGNLNILGGSVTSNFSYVDTGLITMTGGTISGGLYGTAVGITTNASDRTATTANLYLAGGTGIKTFTVADGSAAIDLSTGGLTPGNSTSVIKTGAGLMSIGGSSNYTGSTTINGGTLLLDKTTGGALSASTALTLGGGNFQIKGATSGSSTQTVAGFTLNGGTNNVITLDPNGGTGLTLTLGDAWTRGAGSSMLFDYSSANTGTRTVATANATTGAVLSNGIYGWGLVKDSSGVTGFSTRDGSGNISRFDDTTGTTLDATSNAAASNFTTLNTVYTSGTLTWTNAGALTTRSVNSLTIDTTNNGGTIDLGAAGNILTLTSLGILFKGGNDVILTGGQVGAAASEVIVHQTGTGLFTINSKISSGAGSLTKDGTGMLLLGAANAYTGATTVNGGILRAGVVTNAFGSNSAVTLANVSGVAMDLNNFNQTIGILVGGGASGGNVTLGSGTLTVNSGSSGTYAGVISGTGGLTKSGSGTQTLSGSNLYTGVTTVSGGTLSVSSLANGGASSGIGASSNTSDKLLLGNGTTLAYTGAAVSTDRLFTINGTAAGHGASIDASGSGALNLTNTGNLAYGTTNQTRTLTLTGTSTADNTLATLIADNGTTTNAVAVTKNGAGKWVLGGANTYTGVTTLTAGTLSVGTIGDGGVAGNLGQATNAAGNIVFNGGTLQYTGATATSDRSFTINATKTATIDTANSLTLFGATGTATTGALTKTGSGMLTLTGANTYTGATTINGGSLIVNGSLAAASAVAVNSGGTLGGSGTIGGAVTVNSGGFLAPGNSPGVLTVGSLNLLAGSTTSLEIAGAAVRGTNFDGITITGANGLTYGGTLSFSFTSTLTNGDSLDLFSFTDSDTGNFTSVVSTGSYAGTWTAGSGVWTFVGNDQLLTFDLASGDLTVVASAVPEPSTFALVGGMIALVIACGRSRRRA